VAKFGVFTDAWAEGYQWLVIVAVIASVVAFAFYIRVIVVMYMDDAAEESPLRVGPERWVLALAVGATILWGIFPSSLLDLAADALPI
jgi:NADH-quinone oxidoreductase subunit N